MSMDSAVFKDRVTLLQQESSKHVFENVFIYIPIEIKLLYFNWKKAIRSLREMQRNTPSKQNYELILLVKKNSCCAKVL